MSSHYLITRRWDVRPVPYRKSFTALEVLVAGVIVLTLSALSVPAFASALTGFELGSQATTMKAIASRALATAGAGGAPGAFTVADFEQLALQTTTSGVLPKKGAQVGQSYCVLGWATAQPTTDRSHIACPGTRSQRPWEVSSGGPGQLSLAFASKGATGLAYSLTYGGSGQVAGAASSSGDDGYCTYMVLGPGNSSTTWAIKAPESTCTGANALIATGY